MDLGLFATVAAVVIVLTSVLVIRQQAYELFLLTRIIMASSSCLGAGTMSISDMSTPSPTRLGCMPPSLCDSSVGWFELRAS